MHVRSGNVIVHAGSSWGNSVHAHGTAKVTVICGDGRKVSTRAEDKSEVTVIPGEGSRGFHWVGSGATVTVEDIGTEHRNVLSTEL